MYYKINYLHFSPWNKKNNKLQERPKTKKNMSLKSFYKVTKKKEIQQEQDDFVEFVQGRLDIQNIVKDIMNLKSCVQYMLREEQYAAICSNTRSLGPYRLLKNNEINDKNVEYFIKSPEYKALNHLEKMEMVENSKIL